jgi:hypothetical protein
LHFPPTLPNPLKFARKKPADAYAPPAITQTGFTHKGDVPVRDSDELVCCSLEKSLGRVFSLLKETDDSLVLGVFVSTAHLAAVVWVVRAPSPRQERMVRWLVVEEQVLYLSGESQMYPMCFFRVI